MNAKLPIIFFFSALMAATACAQDYKLVWSDEFDDNTIGKNWNAEVVSAPSNNELQYYTDPYQLGLVYSKSKFTYPGYTIGYVNNTTIPIKNLTDAEYRTDGDADRVNINSALRVYRVYLMSVITDTYGDVPYFEAGKGFLEGKSNPRYDTQEEIYSDFFVQLDSAVRRFDASKDKITGDVIYKGDIAKWKKLANSLRLRYAMRISEAAPEKARTEFEKALAAEGGIIAGASDDALISYMDIAFSFGQEAYSDYRGNAMSQLLFGNDPSNNPSYLCSTLFNRLKDTGDPRTFMIARCYYDGLMSATSPDNRIDLTQEIIAKNVAFQPRGH